jgi:hypothetical protein
MILAVIAVLGIGGGLFLYSKAKKYRLINIAKLEWMIDQMNKSAERSCAAIDKVLEFVEASNKRIEGMERMANRHRLNK